MGVVINSRGPCSLMERDSSRDRRKHAVVSCAQEGRLGDQACVVGVGHDRVVPGGQVRLQYVSR